MKTRKWTSFLAPFLVLAVLSCSKASPTDSSTPPSGGGGGGSSTTGTLVIQWGTDWSPCVQSFLFYVDGLQVGGPTAPGQAVSVTLTAGLHQAQAKYQCSNNTGSYCNLQGDGVSINVGQTTHYGFTKGNTPCTNFCPGFCPQ